MASAASRAAVASHRGKARATARSTPDAATTAWLCVIPCAAIVAIAIYILGPPVGDLLTPSSATFTFLPTSAAATYDTSTETGRYVCALGAPLLLALMTWWAGRRDLPLSDSLVRIVVAAAQALTAALVVACLVVQYRLSYGTVYTRVEGIAIHERYFNPATLVAAALIAAGLLLAVRSERIRTRAGSWLRETGARRWAALAVAVALTVVWLLHAVNTEESIASVLSPVRYHLEFTLDETYAVKNGLTPLVDFTGQYSSLWPLLAALVLGVAGNTLLVFTVTMCALTSLALLAVFGVLRRATGSSVTALLLYVPFLATSMFAIGEASVNRGSFGNYFGIFPLRYAGPFLVAWLVARHLGQRGRGVSAWLLFTAAGLTLINNADFGAAAVGATVAACLWASPAIDRRSLLTLLGWLAAGLATAFALVATFTLLRTGSLPQYDRVTEYARIYGGGGYAMVPLPSPLGLHLVIYITYVAAIGVATVRALRREANRVLTGMLAWAGVFGLGAAAYYVGRSQPEALRAIFSAWALALMLLTYVVLHQLAARLPRRPSIAEVVVLVGFGVAVCSVVQVPLPWSQVDRVEAGFVPATSSAYRHPLAPPQDARTRRFIASIADGPSRFVMRPGAPVAVLLTTGHRIADAYDIANVSPYTGAESIHTVEQVDAVVDALRRAGGNTAILPVTIYREINLPPATIDQGIVEILARRGFSLLTHRGLRPYDPQRGLDDAVVLPMRGSTIIKMVDMKHLHPRALDR